MRAGGFESGNFGSCLAEGLVACAGSNSPRDWRLIWAVYVDTGNTVTRMQGEQPLFADLFSPCEAFRRDCGGTRHLHSCLLDNTVSRIQRAATGGRVLFLYQAPSAPHLKADSCVYMSQHNFDHNRSVRFVLREIFSSNHCDGFKRFKIDLPCIVFN